MAIFLWNIYFSSLSLVTILLYYHACYAITGALGVMYMYGMGVKKNPESAFECLTEATRRGNVYAMGHMVAFYYKRKLFTKCVDMASR